MWNTWAVWRDTDELLNHLDRKLEQIMAALDDLAVAVANNQTQDQAVITAVEDLVAQVAALTAAAGTGDSAAIEAAVAQLNTSAAAVQAAAASDPGAQTPPAAPPAAPVA